MYGILTLPFIYVEAPKGSAKLSSTVNQACSGQAILLEP